MPAQPLAVLRAKLARDIVMGRLDHEHRARGVAPASAEANDGELAGFDQPPNFCVAERQNFSDTVNGRKNRLDVRLGSVLGLGVHLLRFSTNAAGWQR